ncbi:aminopeptidase M1-B [Zea mays]|uniref:Aminopeptidase n=4 Tax=Zea mays TaxID=4577 RepID=A0A1D6KPN1_MAIZE|nr:aminopeptidase M1-B [Zea mays]ONM04756.1 Aminopeptidase M1 [Zea mays]|eukprot:XP_020402293.1 aminopeptidase M1-B [Zea mays]
MAASPDQFRGHARLPHFAAPLRYDLRLRPDLAACTFTGAAAIAVVVSAPTRFLVLNAAELDVDRASIRFQDLAPTDVAQFDEDEIMVISFDRELPFGEGVLTMDFTGTLNDQMRGFYRSKYVYNGESRNMAVTQFEAADARRCFPCWDDPAFKAKFKLTLEVPSDLVALSNMPVAKETVSGLTKTIYYEESPLMSTYLVAIVVGIFDYIESSTSEGTKVRVYTQVGKTNQGKFALDVAVKSLDLYKDYFATPYPLPKLDMIAIPDFSAGAMENYGLVTYRDTALLYDELLSSASNKQQVAITVAHELAHQWFGNLVTMEWWTHLWLNEGFASWVSYLAVESLFPEWNNWTQFLDETTSGLRLDALAESHPIEVEVNHASEIDAIFDSISYDKGASVIRMLQSYLGAECFQKALASYIKKYAYSNAKTEDLWVVLEEESGEPVKDLMTTWTKQQGYPVIYAKINGHDLELEQAQFLSDGSSGPGMWIVPVTACCGSYDAQKKFLLKDKMDKINIKEFSDSQSADGEKNQIIWIKLNIDQTGFYRVKYDDELAAGLVNAIKAKKLSLMDKIGIVEDSYALSVACKQTLTSLLRLLNAYNDESDYTVLSHVTSVCLSISKITVDATPDLNKDIKQLLINLLLPAVIKLGWDPKDGESHLDVMLRSLLLTALVRLGHNETINEGVRRFHIFFEDGKTSLLPPDTRKAAYLAVMRTVSTSSRSGFDALLKIYREASEPQEKSRVLGSLSSSPDQDIVLEALNFMFTDEVRNQDSFYILGGISLEGREIAWTWLKENWDHVLKTWKSSSLISDFIESIVPRFTSEEKAVEVTEFFAGQVKPSFERALKQSLERVRISARWIESIRSEPKLGQTVQELLQADA